MTVKPNGFEDEFFLCFRRMPVIFNACISVSTHFPDLVARAPIPSPVLTVMQIVVLSGIFQTLHERVQTFNDTITWRRELKAQKGLKRTPRRREKLGGAHNVLGCWSRCRSRHKLCTHVTRFSINFHETDCTLCMYVCM